MCCGRIVEKGGAQEVGTYFGDKCLPCDHKNRSDEEVKSGGE